MESAPHVAVVGAGPAGLAAAWQLIAAGTRVTLYERAAAPGGRLRTETLGDARADVAVQLLGSYYRETSRLAQAAGAGHLFVRSPGRDALWRRGRPHPLTYGSVASMAASGALPTGLKLRLTARYLPFLRRHARVLDANQPVRAAAAGLDAESIAAWGRRELGEDFVELLAYPLLAAYYTTVPERTSAGFYHGLARTALDVAVHAVRGGVGALARTLLAALEERGAHIVAATAVRAVGVKREGVLLELGPTIARHDAAVLAVPAPEARRLLTGLEETRARGWLERIHTAPTASLALLLDRPVPADYFGISFPRTEPPGDRIAAICVQERKTPGLVPDGAGLLVVFPAPAVAARITDSALDDSLSLLLPAVEQAFPGTADRIVLPRLFRFPESATPFCRGYLTHLQRFDPSWLPPSLALAGDYLVAPTVEGAVRSGTAAAERVLRLTRSYMPE